MLWLVFLVAVTGVSFGEGSGDSQTRSHTLEIALPTVLGGVALTTVAVIIVICVGCRFYRRVTSLDYVLSSKTKEESRRLKDEKTGLMSNGACTDDDLSTPSTTSLRHNTMSSQQIESEYSEIRGDLITHPSNRLSHSRSVTPADRRGVASSYGAVGRETDEDHYSYIPADKQRHRGRMSTPSDSDGYASSGHTPRARVATNIRQSVKHARSGSYVPSTKERTRLIEAHYETERSVYDRLDFFETEKNYWTPAQNASDLYSQLSLNRYREIPRQSLIMLEQLGSGQFGTVYKGLWVCDGEPLHVAVKALQENASEEEKVKFLQEAALMGQFSHSNIVSMFGVVTVTEPALIVLELATTDLHRYLRGIRLSKQYTSHLPKQLLQFCIDIAAGMEYLSKKCFVHRDLAARNILLDFALVCKIGDFGMARNLMNEEFYTSTENRPLPVKWLAPEALLYRTFSTASDVWSYGMVLYEIWSVGRKPYESLTNQEVIDQLQDPHCHPPPPGIPRSIYSLMVDCWHPEPERRVSFHQLYQSLSQPEELLLVWSAEDGGVSARQLGAEHTHSQSLYADLQTKYVTDSSLH